MIAELPAFFLLLCYIILLVRNLSGTRMPYILNDLESHNYPSSFIFVEIPLEKMVYYFISTENCTPDISGHLIIK